MVGQCSKQTLMWGGSSKPRRNARLCVMRRLGVCVHISTCNMLYFCAIIHNSICFYFTAILSGHAPVQCGENNSVLKPKNTFDSRQTKTRLRVPLKVKMLRSQCQLWFKRALSVHKLLSLCQRAGGQPSTVGLNFNGFWLRRMYVHNLGL